MRAMLMRTCLADHVAPGIAAASARVLQRLGVTVTVPKAQTCCGQPGWSAGHPDQARTVARQALRAFAGTDPVVVPSGSCAAMVTHGYADMFAGHPEEDAAKDLAGRTFELTQFIHHNGLAPAKADDAPVTVTYHDSCHMLRLLRERESPRAIIAAAGLELVEMADSDVCCGFGGAFSVTFPEVSGALGEQKARSAADTGAEELVACDLSCLMHIVGRGRRIGVPIRARHVVELLDG